MRGKIAKEIRKEIYKGKDPRAREYFAQTKKMGKVSFIVGGIMADLKRQAYQQLKKDYKEAAR